MEKRWYYSSSGRRSTRRAGQRAAWRLAHSRRHETATTPPSRFIQRVLQTCTNEHTDGARRWRSMAWYPGALHRLGVPWERVTFGKRNAVEQWFSVFKQRVKRFYRRWPHNARGETIASWCETYVALYNLERA